MPLSYVLVQVVYSYLLAWFWDGVVKRRRESKLERLKAEILPTHPKSQVCPKCLHVKRLI